MISGPDFKINVGNSILGIAGYYTDFDGLQHVIVAANDGNVYEVYWNQRFPPVQRTLTDLGTSLVDIAGFFTDDDEFNHAVGITSDGTLHELYFKSNGLPNRNDLPHNLINSNNFDPKKGAAGFYSPGDSLRHVVIVEKDGHLVDITWSQQQSPNRKEITIQPPGGPIASISGFGYSSTDGNTCHISVAFEDQYGSIYDIDYPDEAHLPQTIGQDHLKTSFGEPVQNVTAFFSRDNNYRHNVVLTKSNLLKDNAYDIQGNSTGIVLASSSQFDLQDMTSYYTTDDYLRHVILATKDGSLYEITYTSQG
jgi:hypothetical protein